MKNSLVETNKLLLEEEFPLEYAEILPKNLSIPNTVQYENINLSMEKLKYLLVNEGKTTGDIGQFESMCLNSPTTTNKKVSLLTAPLEKEPRLKHTKNNLVDGVLNINNYTPNNKENPQDKTRSKSNVTGKMRVKSNIEPQKEAFDYKMNYDITKSPEPKTANDHKREIKELMYNKNSKVYNNKKVFTTNKGTNKAKPNDKGTHNQPIESSNMVLLNTLNYKNIDKWEQSQQADNSIEEIYDLDDNKIPNNFEKNDAIKILK
jgi:hypothetical protein